MKNVIILLCALIPLLFSAVSCTYDDTDLKNKVDNLDSRLTELEQVVKQLNTNVGSLMTIVNALENQVKIEDIITLEDGSGYVIKFTDGKVATIVNGKDGENGEDGKTPAITVEKDADGLYYWKVSGEWLLDDGGNKIPATSKTEVPQIRVNETTGNFELSFDGENWQDIGSAGGAGIFKDVVDGEDEVVFILSGDKEPIVIPKAQKFAINVNNSSIPVDAPGTSITVSYTVTDVDKETVVDAIATGGFIIEKIENQIIGSDIHGNITIQIPDPIPANGKVFLFAVNSKGTTSSRILSFEQGVFNVRLYGSATIVAEGGELALNVQTNYNYDVVIPDDAKSWISYEIQSKAVRQEFLVLQIAENKDSERSAVISLVDGMTVRYSFTLTQEGAVLDVPGYKGHIEDWKDDGSIDF